MYILVYMYEYFVYIINMHMCHVEYGYFMMLVLHVSGRV